MASFLTSHASLGSSTLNNANKEERTADFSIGGPEDFTAALFNHTLNSPTRSPTERSNSKTTKQPSVNHPRNVPPTHCSAHPNRSPELTNSSSIIGGPADFTANISEYLRSARPTRPSPPSSLHSPNITASSLGGPADLTQNLQTHIESSRRNRGRKLQPTVSDEDDEPRDESVSPIATTVNPSPEPTTSLPGWLLDEELPAPQAESTPALRPTSRSLATANKQKFRDGSPPTSTPQQNPPQPAVPSETDLLRQEIEQLKLALMQRDNTIAGLQTALVSKDAECVELRRASTTQINSLTKVVNKASAAAKAKDTQCQDMSAATKRELAEKDSAIEKLNISLQEKAAAAVKTDSAVSTLVARSAALKDAMIAAEDEAAGLAQHNERLARKVEALTLSTDVALEKAKRAEREMGEREEMWAQRADVLLAEIERRGRALMIAVGERELPGVKDQRGRQAYRYAGAKARRVEAGLR